MDLGLDGRIAIVNGASQGIGYAIARTLAEEGARVAISGRREAPLAAARDDMARRTGGELLAIPGDIRQAGDCERIVAGTVAHYGGLDILVNNDGAPPLGPFLDFDDDAWRRAVDRNLMSVVRCIRAAAPHMKARGAGSIVNITALSAIQPIAGFGLSVATWAGVIGLAKTLSRELAPEITINTLAPGLIDTPRLRLVAEQSTDEMSALIRDIPLGRLGDAEEVGAAVAFLVSPRGRYITGTTLAVDGGLSRATF